MITIGKQRYIEYPEFKEDGLACGKNRLGDLIKQNGGTFSYMYDFGDSWEHEIIIEDSRYFNPELSMDLICLDGERARPPEDVGGVPGYFEFRSALKDTKHEEHESYMGWIGGGFDSELFDNNLVNWNIIRYLRWSRPRYQDW